MIPHFLRAIKHFACANYEISVSQKSNFLYSKKTNYPPKVCCHPDDTTIWRAIKHFSRMHTVLQVDLMHDSKINGLYGNCLSGNSKKMAGFRSAQQNRVLEPLPQSKLRLVLNPLTLPRNGSFSRLVAKNYF